MPTKHSQQERSNEKGVSTEPEASKDHEDRGAKPRGARGTRDRGPGGRATGTQYKQPACQMILFNNNSGREV